MISLTGNICTFVVCTPTCIPSSYNNEMHNVEVPILTKVCSCLYSDLLLQARARQKFVFVVCTHTLHYTAIIAIDCMRSVCTMNAWNL